MASTRAQDPTRPEPIGQLIYRSVSATPAGGAIEIADILEEARARNAERGVTGVLTVVDDHFIQILEGSDAALDELLGVLGTDRRHSRLTVLERRHVDRHEFADWSMVSPRLTPSCVAGLSALLTRGEDRIDAYLPLLMSALAAQDRLMESMCVSRRDDERSV